MPDNIDPKDDLKTLPLQEAQAGLLYQLIVHFHNVDELPRI